jgi:hypothetical protein
VLTVVLDQVVMSAEPAVTFSSLAGSCVPALADACVINLRDDLGAAFQMRQPFPLRCANDSAKPGPDAGHSVTVVIRDEDCGGEPGYNADVTFQWQIAPDDAGADGAAGVIAELLTERAVHLIRQERLSAALLREIDRSVHLTDALASTRLIGQALGILMCTYKLTSEQAFDLLRGVSQHTHRKLRDIAADVNLTGALIVTPASTQSTESDLHIIGGDA